MAEPVAASFFVPGRIEVLGKHTDYAGGASITCATTRGFRLSARPGRTGGVSVQSADGRFAVDLPLDPEVHAGGWANYVATVIRRVVRNAPGAVRPADLVFESDLAPAAGMSSSSAFMIAIFLGLDAASEGRLRESIADVAHSLSELAEYLACIENGASYGRLEGERGVGTRGGSQDHTAILCSRAGRLRRYRYAPYAEEGDWDFWPGHSIVVAASGVVAAKTGAAMEDYNRASWLASEAAAAWSLAMGQPARHLADVLGADPDAAETVRRFAARGGAGNVHSADLSSHSGDALSRRIRAFAVEMECVERASHALAAGDLATFAAATRDSQAATEALLGNQVPETKHLAATAERYGAVAASAFGAGFGGSVWALVESNEADRFIRYWRADYAAAFPEAESRSAFVAESAGPEAGRVDGTPIW